MEIRCLAIVERLGLCEEDENQLKELCRGVLQSPSFAHYKWGKTGRRLWSGTCLLLVVDAGLVCMGLRGWYGGVTLKGQQRNISTELLIQLTASKPTVFRGRMNHRLAMIQICQSQSLLVWSFFYCLLAKNLVVIGGMDKLYHDIIRGLVEIGYNNLLEEWWRVSRELYSEKEELWEEITPSLSQGKLILGTGKDDIVLDLLISLYQARHQIPVEKARGKGFFILFLF